MACGWPGLLVGGDVPHSQPAAGGQDPACLVGLANIPAADYKVLPIVTFTDPEIGAAGLTETQARQQGLAVRTGITWLPSSARGWIHMAGNDGFIKLIEDSERGVLVGTTSAGWAGGEVLGALAVAIHGRVPVAGLRTMIYAYPTFHRAIEDAPRDLDADDS